MTAPATGAYVGSAILLAWGLAHLAPTRAVADGFGPISRDNRRILVMEWIAEGIMHIALATLVVIITAVEGATAPATELVLAAVAAVLLLIAALTAATGARTPVIWFRVCPFVLTGVASLYLLAAAL